MYFAQYSVSYYLLQWLVVTRNFLIVSDERWTNKLQEHKPFRAASLITLFFFLHPSPALKKTAQIQILVQF